MKRYLAHIDSNGHREHTLTDHLRATGKLAGEFSDVFHMPLFGQVVGLIHDLGKASTEFQKRLAGDKQRVDHATAGAQWLHERFKNTGRLLAYPVAGHHGGMPDGFSDSNGALEMRLKKEIPHWDKDILPALELPDALPGLPIKLADTKKERSFQVGFLVRMLFSCLVDADFLDTEAFFDSEKGTAREGYPELSVLRQRLETHLATLGANPGKVNTLRGKMLSTCRKGAQWEPGFFSLTIPTGGGKTLASLAFALDHAQRHDLKRVIYAIPYTSIIEQTAAVFRKAVGKEAVLEHHSNYDYQERTEDSEHPHDDSTIPAARRARLATENWDAPVVVTTNVQFFESLFHNRPGRCRRLHNIAKSVVILDEAQMLPVDYLLPCLAALRELVRNYGVSVVLCTATQPALSKREDFPHGLEGVRELMEELNPEQLAEELKRVSVHHEGILSDEDLIARLSAETRVLCIVNTRSHARRLFAAVREGVTDQDEVLHLSANMCAAHRTQKLQAVYQRLKDGLPCRVISTQLVEAGVDLDFPVVYRAQAGTDSLAQAAGRCNREGNLQDAQGLPCLGRVHVFDISKNDLPPGLLRQTAQVGQEILRKHQDPLSLKALKDYFQTLYWQKEDLDPKQILAIFSEGASQGNYNFRKVAETFQLIDDSSESLIVPWDEDAKKLVEQLKYVETPRVLLRSLQRYTISISPWVMQTLEQQGGVEVYQERYRVLSVPALYRDEVGLDLEGEIDPAALIS